MSILESTGLRPVFSNNGYSPPKHSGNRKYFVRYESAQRINEWVARVCEFVALKLKTKIDVNADLSQPISIKKNSFNCE